MHEGDTLTPEPTPIDTTALVERLEAHPLYARLDDPDALRVFMRAHVFAVWDFQCLLKALQRELTCVEVPWLPTADPATRRMINEIVLDEESDITPEGGHLSHYELYLRAMEDAGADTAPVRSLLDALAAGIPVEQALERDDLPPGVRDFVALTLRIASSGEAHRIAAAFTYGREEVIPGMFRQVVERLAELAPEEWGCFRFYLQRHIDLDGDEHGPLARELVASLCAEDASRWREAQSTASEVLEARIRLWDETLGALRAEVTAGSL